MTMVARIGMKEIRCLILILDATTKDDLRDLFVGFGTIKSIEIPKDKDGLARYISSILVTASGFAFIAYESTDEASRVLNERVVCHGRTLSIQLSKRNSGYKPTPGVFLGKNSYSGHYRSHDYRRRSRSHRSHSRSRLSPSRSRSDDRHGSRSHGYHSRSRTRSHTHHSRSHAHRSPSDYRRGSSEHRTYSSSDGHKYDYEIRKHLGVCFMKQLT
ncbi:peptidyl-prolyl cis-trans isomerase [Blastocystis sp. subtype 4]|uniref:peptidyl-prolyl cis-trans isomerase n=1 Tax=Blastocystis sp. subtype 4 TaxID=944170 RepID=UPI000711884A|nr:peptidyl-prolyl cis-trans isomerase [Blastocystis sp. subtype 4]KNB43444.1 peptidyl-prolyl cis-trans isomerase [Blastocystis sp. subtype 4]|eukprot:XP_014526887.1 peptidyl-prolyl cis-trans isomerase [Blastocystis sp. subtype 4]